MVLIRQFSMSGTYGHPATESLVATLQGTEYDTGLDIPRLEKLLPISVMCVKICQI